MLPLVLLHTEKHLMTSLFKALPKQATEKASNEILKRPKLPEDANPDDFLFGREGYQYYLTHK